jgi:subtilisin family serine protease
MTRPIGRVAALLVLLGITGSLTAQQTERYLIGTRQEAQSAAREILRAAVSPRSGRSVRVFDALNTFAVELTPEEAASLRRFTGVRYVERVVPRHVLSDSVAPGDETIPYGVNVVHAPAVWPATKGAHINVVVVDTGVACDHPELRRACRGGWNTFDDSSDARDENGHGTRVAGVTAASHDSSGIAGIAPDVDLWAVKVFDACGYGDSSRLVSAVNWVISQKNALGGNWIMNLSLGDDTDSEAERDAFQRAADAGILSFAASGNSYAGKDGVKFPAAYPTVVAVGATDIDGNIAPFSQRGADLELVAPGVNVLSSAIGEEIITSGGDRYDAVVPVSPENACLAAATVTAPFVFCGYGASAADFPPSVRGNIALIQRGSPTPANSVTFAQKARNAFAAGAAAAVIYDNIEEAELTPPSIRTEPNVSGIAPFVFVSKHDGEALRQTPAAILTMSFDHLFFALGQGTSMATPHVSASAALVWSLAPAATSEQINLALFNNAHDLGDAGYDTTFGFGLVDAFASAKALAPQSFAGSGEKRRAVRH